MNSIIEIERCFTQVELNYLMPLLKKWTKHDYEVINWFNTHQIPSCADKTPSELCDLGEKDRFLQYVKHIEYGGFS
jgi:hypothetical protein